MWRSSGKGQRGFGLVELLVVLVTLTIILVLTGQLVFAMRRSALQQQYQVDARQTARGAVDYINFMLRGALDPPNQPAGSVALLFRASWGGTDTQLTYDNVTDANLADVGTDIITFARFHEGTTITPVRAEGGDASGGVWWWGFDDGCRTGATQAEREAANLALFKQLTGFVADSSPSEPLLLLDDSGQAAIYQICSYTSAHCDVTAPCDQPCVVVQANTSCTGGIIPAGGYAGMVNPRLVVGLRYATLRVKHGWLQQKDGIFDPANPDDGFVPILPNVEDLQIAYIFDRAIGGSGLADVVWNNDPTHTLPAGQGRVPDATQARQVIGVRITVTGRAAQEQRGAGQERFYRPRAENHPGGEESGEPANGFARFTVSSTALLRNRIGGM
jgi:type II secretory pathway pseudopilin PulG